jgi:hypothetical protein
MWRKGTHQLYNTKNAKGREQVNRKGNMGKQRRGCKLSLFHWDLHAKRGCNILLVTFEQREMWRKVHYCFFHFFWVKEVLLFVFVGGRWVGRYYCIGPNLTMVVILGLGVWLETKPYFHGDILVVHVF